MPERPRTLIVTGASSGIGRALALQAAREGYRVVAIARREAALIELCALIRSSGGACARLVGDVTARDMPSRIVETAKSAFAGIDVLVNNAGAGAYGALLEQSDGEIDAQWQLNVAAPLRISRAALPDLKSSRGQLIFIGSSVGRVPLPRQGAYALSKAAIRAAATQLRRELRPLGVAVTYVDPGVAATEFHSSLRIERPPGRIVAADRVARAILRGVRRRSAVVNAVPWQTAFATLAEWLGTLADPVVTRRYTVRRSPVPPDAADLQQATEATVPQRDFETALQPLARRMERVKLTPGFLREALLPGATLELGTLAMHWAGMPNKNERAALREALDALTVAGYLESLEDETWRVVRAAE